MPYNPTSVFIFCVFKRIKNKIQLKWNEIKKNIVLWEQFPWHWIKDKEIRVITMYVQLLLKKFPENRNKKIHSEYNSIIIFKVGNIVKIIHA